ncbi:MAG: sigma 54-interacting transcriptional regulator [Candidatus Krumholzibacteria bacterium]|jgi:transcriptional regulator with PAS, ATPase and Fis domain|nr:sigma 54-interacting transcriptional regulator [Candidatus Krumholzibacteria bacterium]MDP6668351.1 sigma 54-interacting transcriptional regulator [Candidatus Krumholzibacteria bacterium]MDP6796289.1 sigma 54-interacting transcriptional regulator [Candidatus Krumholzibacteria bacterium]MDP7022194.1 sigma 54-interacting transcriptional regulator [Candidatus Krumholzibacteria bacterium]
MTQAILKSHKQSNDLKIISYSWVSLRDQEVVELENQLPVMDPTAEDAQLSHFRLLLHYYSEGDVSGFRSIWRPLQDFRGGSPLSETLRELTRVLSLRLESKEAEALEIISGLETSSLPPELQIRLRILQGNLYRKMGETELAERCLERVSSLLPIEGASHEYEALRALGLTYQGILNKGLLEFALASRFFERAAELFQKTNHRKLEARARFNRSVLLRKMGKLQECRKEVALLQEMPLPDARRVLYLNEFTKLFIALEDRSTSGILLQEIEGRMSDKTALRSRIVNLEARADALALDRDWHRALLTLDEGIELALGISDSNDLLGELYRRKTQVLYELERDQESFEMARLALEVCEKVNEVYEIGAIFRTLALLAERRGESSEAESLFLRSIDFYLKREEKVERAKSQRHLARFYQRRNHGEDLHESFRHAAAALGLYEEMGIESRRAEMREMLDTLGHRLPRRDFTAPEGIRIAQLGQEHNIITADTSMTRVLETLVTVAPSRSAILVTGETGTGKELIARAAHSLSDRREESFVIVNCAAIPGELMESELFGHVRGSFTGAHGEREGKFSQANRGSIFLDEIGDLGPRLQAKLLRVLQDGSFSPVGSDRELRVDVRVISATNRNLEARVMQGEFRQDLLYRLNHVLLELPPLRKRGGDAELLASYFLHRESDHLGRNIEMDEQVLDLIRNYPWPGNVRELESFIRRASLFAAETGILSPDLVPERYFSPLGECRKDLASVVRDAERHAILDAVSRSRGNKAQAARDLSISRSTLNEKISRYELAQEIRKLEMARMADYPA